MNEEKLAISKDRISTANIKCSKKGLDKLADWTKDMDDLQLDDFLQRVRNAKKGADDFLNKATNKPTPAVETTPAAKGGIMSKLTQKFKPVGQFFCKVKSAIKSVADGFTKTKFWQGMKKYGFDAIGAIMAAASIGMCVHQAVTTIQGAAEMNRKLEKTLEKVKDTRAELDDAKENVANITGLQKQLFANLTRDAVSMLKFFVNDTTENEGKDRPALQKLKAEVAKETPKFRDLLAKMSTVGSSQASQGELKEHLKSFKKLLRETRLSLVRIYQKVKISIQIKNSVKTRTPVAVILRNLVASGFNVKGTWPIVKEIAWSNKELNDYDNYPLNCIRKGIIENQLELDQFMKASGTKVISDEVKEIIKMAVEFFKSPVDTGERSILNLLKMRSKLCGDSACTADDVLTAIAQLHPDWEEYDGYNLDDFRKGHNVC